MSRIASIVGWWISVLFAMICWAVVVAVGVALNESVWPWVKWLVVVAAFAFVAIGLLGTITRLLGLHEHENQ